MEGKGEEITKAEDQGRELKKRLKEEELRSRNWKWKKYRERMFDLDKLESVFNKSKWECSQLYVSLDKEKNLTKDFISELELVKGQVKELESSEARLGKSGLILKDDLTKLKSFTVMLVDKRRGITDKLNQEKQKVNDLNNKLKWGQSKTTQITVKLIEESKKLLKMKSEMEEKVSTILNERDELKVKLKDEELKSNDLNFRVGLLKKRLHYIEEVESDAPQNKAKNELEELSGDTWLDDNKIKEFTLEME
ncbi:filamin A-interacting protein 1-like [Cetorhinus maximus]